MPDAKPRHSRFRRWVVRPVVYLAVIMIFFRWFEHANVYHPSKVLDGSPEDVGLPFEEVSVTTSDAVKVHGWFIPAPTNSPRAGFVVLVSHGNAGNISHRTTLAGLLRRHGVAVLLYDYRGYGRSEGRPSEDGTYRDALAFYGWLKQRGFAPEKIISYGESLGGGIASELARREKVGALVLQSTFTSIPDVGAELFWFLPVRLISTIKYDTRSRLPQIHVPVLVVHSEQDEIVKFSHAEKNFAAANEPKLLVAITGSHNDGLFEKEEMFHDGMEKLLKLAGAPPVSADNE